MQALEKQVGGTAEATANDSDKMAVAWGNLTEELGTQLLPAFEQLTEMVLAATSVLSEHSGLIVGVGAAVAALAATVLAINAAMKVWTALTVAYNAVQLVLNSRLAITAALTIKATASIIAEKVAMVASTAAMVAKNAIMLVVKGATIAYTAAQWALNAALTANPIGLVIVAVVALVAAIVLAYKKSETFRNVVNAVFSFLKSVLRAYIGVYIAVFQKMWEWAQKIIDKIQELARKVREAFTIRAPSWLGGIFSSSAGGTLVMGGAGVLAATPAATYGRVTINVYGDPDPYTTARTVKRALEGYDVSMGRAPGTPMAKAW
jgi:phage-related protein